MESAPASDRGALSIVWDTIVAPKSAFEALRDRPRWLVVYIVICVLGMAGAFLQISAGEHITAAVLHQKEAHDPQFASMSPAQIARVTESAEMVQHFVWLIYPVIAIVAMAFAALLLLVGNAIARGAGTFAQYFALAAHVGLVNLGIYYLLLGVLAASHPPDSFTSQSDLLRLTPSLAWFAPANATTKTVTLLSGFNPFAIWSFVLLALGLQTIGSVKAVAAYVIAFVVAFGGLVFAVLLAP